MVHHHYLSDQSRCGGGIYAKALIDIGAIKVIGMDFSESNLEGARENCKSYQNIDFMVGNALETGLPDNEVDLILERTLIHHIRELALCFSEAKRVLKPNGIFIIQDRTPEDCFAAGQRDSYPRIFL